MQIKKITIRNFMSFGNHPEEFQIDTNNLTIVLGKNGQGKSTIYESICFALYGKTLRNIKKADIVNKINRKDCRIDLEFTQRGDMYKIIRGISPNIFEIYKNDSLISQSSSVLDYQSILETEVIGYNYDLFRQLVLLNPASFVSFFEMKSKDRRGLLEQLLGLHEVGIMNQFLQGYIAENKTEMIESSSQQKEIHNTIKTLQRGIDDANTKKELSNIDYDVKLQELESKKSKVITMLESISSNNVDLDQLKYSIDSTNNTIQKLKNVQFELRSRMKRIDTELDFIESNESCPNCKQTISNDHKTNMSKDYSHELDSINTKVNTIVTKLDELLSQRDNDQKIVEDVKLANDKIKQYTSALKIIDVEINSIMDKKQIVYDDSNIQFLSNELNGAIARLETISNEIAKLQITSQLYQSTKDFLSDNGIRKIVVAKYLPFLIQRINYWLEQFEYHAIVSIDDDFEETIKVRGFDPTRYSALSSGEKAKLTVSLVLSFRELLELRNNSNIQLLVLDEVLENIDSEAKLKLFWNLRHIAEQNDTAILLVSHGVNETSLDPFHKQIKVTKSGNFSKITEEQL